MPRAHRRAARAAPEVGARPIRPLLQPGTAASNARIVHAGTETPSNGRSDPVTPGTEWIAPRVRTRSLSAAEVLPSHSPIARRNLIVVGGPAIVRPLLTPHRD